MSVSLNSTCLHALCADPKPSLSCTSKLFVGLKPQSAGAFGAGKPNVNVDFHNRVHKSLQLRVSGINPTRARISMMPIGTPRVPFRTPGEGTWQRVDLWNALLTPSMAIYDTMQSLKSAVATNCVGYAYNLAGFLLAAGEKGNRVAMPLCRIALQSPAGSARGQADDIQNEANELLRIRDYLYWPSHFSRLYPSQLNISAIYRGQNHKAYPRTLYSRQKYLRFNPICLATGTPDRDNWAFTSPYDVLKEQMRNNETGGNGGNKGPPRRGGGGGRNGDDFGGNADENSSENLDEMIQVTLATIGFVTVYGYLMRGAELTRLGRDYVIYLVRGTASARLLREKEKWVNLYEDITRTIEIPKLLLHQIVLYSIAWLQNPKKLVLIK